MKRYNYDKDSKEFLFVSDAQRNPKRSGEYLIPKNSTNIVPPDTDKHQVAVFNGEFWDIKDDFRGLEQINLETKEISCVKSIGKLQSGFVLYSDYVKTDDYKKYLLEQEKESVKTDIMTRINEIDLKRIRAICEPEMKDETQSWLDYYNSQILELRNRLLEVENDTSC